MSSPSLSDSPGTFKVDRNVTGAILDNRPKFKSLQNSSDHLLSTRKSFKLEKGLDWFLHQSFELGSRTRQVLLLSP